MNANVFMTNDYENETAFRPQKNKPKTNPISPTPIFEPNTRTPSKMNKENLKNLPKLTFTGTPDPPVFPQAGHLFDQAKRIPLFLGGFWV